MARVRIAVFSGPTATIANSPPLVTSNKARARHGLPLLTRYDGEAIRFDALRAQRLAAPVTLYVEAYTAHPLEDDARELYGPPDGWLDTAGVFSETEPVGGGTPVFVIELDPKDGLYPLPYMARQADGSAWEEAASHPDGAVDVTRQTFYPDASRIYEEIDRLGLDGYGQPEVLSGLAEFDFYRAAPPGGYTKGLAAQTRSDTGAGDIPPELLGEDYFPYDPHHLAREPTLTALAQATNLVQSVLADGDYAGAQWLEGSPSIEETLFWLGLVVDTAVPLVGHSAQRPHGSLSADGDRNIVDGAKFIASGTALDESGRNRLGALLIVDEMVYSAREVTKVDSRPGGYELAGGHGGVVADMGGDASPQVTYIPNRKHTHRSDVRLPLLPATVTGLIGSLGTEVRTVDVPIKDLGGNLLASAMPVVTIVKYGRYSMTGMGPADNPDPAAEVEILSRIATNLGEGRLAGFVNEGMSPYGYSTPSARAAFQVAIYSGMPVARVGRGNTGGMADRSDPMFVAANNLTSTKARLLLMAAMLKLGALPPAVDPYHPTGEEARATLEAVRKYQQIFDSH